MEDTESETGGEPKLKLKNRTVKLPQRSLNQKILTFENITKECPQILDIRAELG